MNTNIMLSVGFVLLGVVIGILLGYVSYVVPMLVDLKKFSLGIESNTKTLLDLNTNALLVDATYKDKAISLELDLVRLNTEFTNVLTTNTAATLMLHSDVAALEAVNSVLTLENAKLKETTNSLFKTIEGLNADVATLETINTEATESAKSAISSLAVNLAKPNQPVVDIMVDLREAVTELLTQLGNPTTSYEAGVYNGIISIANTLLDEDSYLMVKPLVEASNPSMITMPKRDTKGRFLKPTV